MKIYNGENMLLGRLASRVAKDALLGEEVKVVNCEKIVLSGKKVLVFKEEKEKRLRKGYPLKSAKRIRLPDRHVRRSIRGMLPWKQARGKDAFKRIMCCSGIPEILADKDLIILKDSSVKKLPTRNHITVGELCKHVGGK